MHHRAVEFAGVAGVNEAAACLLRQTGYALLLNCQQVETDDVRDEVSAVFLQHPRDLAGVLVAGLDPVGKQDQRRIVCVAHNQRSACRDNSAGQRRASLG